MLVKKIFLFLLPIVAILFLATPLASHAAGLVPCGGANEPACQFCHIFVLLKNIFDFVLKIVIIVAALMFVVGGVYFITSAANPGGRETGKKILFAATIGTVIILSSWLIVNSVLTFPGLVNANFSHLEKWYDPGSWFSVNCPQ